MAVLLAASVAAAAPPPDIDGDGVPNAEDPCVHAADPADHPLFGPARSIDAGGHPIDTLAVGDVDGDGRPDVAFTANVGPEPALGVYRNLGGGAFNAPLVVHQPSTAWDVALGDVDGDGDLDLVTQAANHPDGSLGWFENTGGMTFAPEGESITDRVGVKGYRQRTHVVDLDGDGRAEVLHAGTVYWNHETGFLAESVLTEVLDGVVTQMSARDLDRDGGLDVIGSGDLNVGVRWFRATPTGLDPGKQLASLSGSFLAFAFADLDGDGNDDLLVQDADGVQWLLDAGEVEFGPLPNVVDSQAFGLGGGLQAADLDGDGRVDVVAVSEPAELQWWKNLGGGHFTVATLIGEGAPLLVITDLDGDGDPDAVVPALDGGFTWFENLGPLAYDGDGDGWCAQDECDDAEAAVFPGAPEICNGSDDDCDGAVESSADCMPAAGDGARGCGCVHAARRRAGLVAWLGVGMALLRRRPQRR